MGYRTIAVGTDGSETAELARQAATRLAKRCRAELLIISAYEPPGVPGSSAREILDEAESRSIEDGISVKTAMALGEPSKVIVDVARREGADLIVAGNRGMGKASRFQLSGVPDRIAHTAPCDFLLVITTHTPGPDDPLGLYRNFLIGTDGSATASEAVRKGFELALMLKAGVSLVYVGDDEIVGGIALEEAAASRLGRTEVMTTRVGGDPATRICEVAVDGGHDLIVVGNKGMAGARRYLLASVPNGVAHNAPTDVLIVKTVGRSLTDIAPGHGGVVTDPGGRTVAAYRDPNGEVTTLSPRCTHMGCTVDWNDADQTWDCPCHGSRFAVSGEVLDGPAAKPLPPV
ncbi:MAG TPA: universal stress protein [Actinomycetota bacterium]